MKKILLVLFLFLLALAEGQAQNLTLMTYNIRLALESDEENVWEQRKCFVLGQIKEYHPGVIGTQEGLPNQIAFLNEALSGYNYEGVPRDDGVEKGEHCAIFYDSTRFRKREGSTFWLSETPDRPSKGWDAAYTRICTYILLIDKLTGKSFWIFNTHLDNRGEEARREALKLILDKMEKVNKNGNPVILMGDFNFEPSSGLMSLIEVEMKDSRAISRTVPKGPVGTFNGFEWSEFYSRRIDYIFLSGESLAVERYEVIQESQDRKYPSDHFPVLIELAPF